MLDGSVSALRFVGLRSQFMLCTEKDYPLYRTKFRTLGPLCLLNFAPSSCTVMNTYSYI
jgi:hypothetical protein